MRKATRKQKKLQKNPKLRDPLINSELKDIVLFLYEREFNTYGQSEKTFLVSEEDFQHFADDIATSKTIEKLSIVADVGFLSLIAEALKTNTSVKCFQYTQTIRYSMEQQNKAFESFAIILQSNRITSMSLPIATTQRYYENNLIDPDSFSRFVEALKNNTSLTSLTTPLFRAEVADDLIDAIIEHPTLSDVSCHSFWHFIRGPSVAKLISANRIQRLICRETAGYFAHPSARPIFEALKKNTSLTELAILGLGRLWKWNEQDIATLAEALEVNQTLTTLDINGNCLGLNMAKILEALQNNKSLTKLDFWKNDLDSTIAPALRAVLLLNESLTELDLSSAKLNDYTCQQIGPALKHNRSITSLNMFCNPITSEGCKYLAEGLKFNKTLIRVDLKESHINDEGCKYLGEAIKTNPCLLHLDISGPEIRVHGFKALIDGMKDNESLTELTVSRAKSVPRELHEEILNAQKRNKQYQRDLIVNTITMLIQIARSDAFDQFPLEIWLRIFKYFVCGGVPGFNHIAESILMHSDVRDVKSLCQMKIIRINGKSHLVSKNIQENT
jgi:hypothetical protein